MTTVGEDKPMNPENPVRPAPEWAPATRSYRQLMLTTLRVVLLAVLVFLLEKFATVLQQLFTAAFLAYALLPLQRWLVRHGVPSALAYLFITLTLFTLGVLAVLAVQGSF